MPLIWHRRAMAMLSVVATGALLVLTGQSAGAVTARHGVGASRPAAIDGATGPAAHVARPHVAPASAHNVPNELLAQTLAEDDADQQPEPPTISAHCQDFLGQPNPYPNPAPNVDAINGDATVPVGSQTGCQTAQNETAIAVNPFNPNNIVAGANDYRVFNTRESRNDSAGFAYASFDGGHTFTDVQLPHLAFHTGATGALSDMDGVGDPAVTFGPHNTVYYANISFSRLNGGSAITMSVSHNGGLTWDDPSIVTLDGADANGNPLPTDVFNDKEWVAADPFSGTVYVTWTRFLSDDAGNFVEAPIVMKKSTDFGKHWGAMVRIAPSMTNFQGGITPFDQGSNPVVANDGSLYVAYEASVCATLACDSAGDHDAVVVATSHNGGKSFKNAEVALDFDFPPNEDVGSSTLTGLNFRINSFPQMAIDRLTGKLWVTWADDSHGQYTAGGESIKTNGDNFVTGSIDGRHWSTPVTVGTASDEVFGAIAALGGRVVVGSYTRNYDPNGDFLDFAIWSGWGSGVGSAPIRRVTTVSEDPNVQFVGIGQISGQVLQGEFVGDYNGLAIGADFRVHPAWTDFRGNPGVNTPNQDLYTQSLSAF